jgi:hypothetical protein
LNDEQSRLLRKAQKRLAVARSNLELGYTDSAISEAYYVMFHAAKAALIEKQIFRRRHSGVIAAFGATFAKPGIVSRDLQLWLVAAEKDRVVADYSTEDMATDLGREHIDHAEKFVAAIRALLEKA